MSRWLSVFLAVWSALPSALVVIIVWNSLRAWLRGESQQAYAPIGVGVHLCIETTIGLVAVLVCLGNIVHHATSKGSVPVRSWRGAMSWASILPAISPVVVGLAAPGGLSSDGLDKGTIGLITGTAAFFVLLGVLFGTPAALLAWHTTHWRSVAAKGPTIAHDTRGSDPSH